jgi:hypothetical protein
VAGIGKAKDSDFSRGDSGEPPLFRLRHLAGLSSGRTLDLDAGGYAFGPRSEHLIGLAEGDPDRVTFEVEVTDGGVVLTPADSTVSIDGISVRTATDIEAGQMIELPADRFLLERVGGPRSSTPLPDQLATPRLVPVPVPTRGIRTFLRRRQAQDLGQARASQLRRFGDDVALHARAVAAQQRERAGSPLATGDAAASGIPTPLSPPFTLSVGVTVKTEPYQPERADDHPIEPELQAILTKRAVLSSLPITIDSASETMGIIGPRALSLAAARHLITTNSTSVTPRQVDFDIGDDRVDDWSLLPSIGYLAKPTGTLTVIDRPEPILLAMGEGHTALVLATNLDELPPGCTAVLKIEESGAASFTRGDEPARAVIPSGISGGQADDLTNQVNQNAVEVEAIASPADPRSAGHDHSHSADATPAIDHGGAVLVIGDDLTITNELLASLTLDLLGRPENRGLEMYIIDRGDRALIRLVQLPHLRGYATIDDVAGIERVLTAIEATLASKAAGPNESDAAAIFLVSEVGPLVRFLQQIGRSDLVERIERVLTAHDRIHLLVAASAPQSASLQDDHQALFASHLHCSEFGTAELITADGSRLITTGGRSGRGLTEAISHVLAA